MCRQHVIAICPSPLAVLDGETLFTSRAPRHWLRTRARPEEAAMRTGTGKAPGSRGCRHGRGWDGMGAEAHQGLPIPLGPVALLRVRPEPAVRGARARFATGPRHRMQLQPTTPPMASPGLAARADDVTLLHDFDNFLSPGVLALATPRGNVKWKVIFQNTLLL